MYVNTFLIFIFRNFWAVAATYPNGETSLAFKLFDRKLRATRKNGFFYGSLALAVDDTPAEKEKEKTSPSLSSITRNRNRDLHPPSIHKSRPNERS